MSQTPPDEGAADFGPTELIPTQRAPQPLPTQATPRLAPPISGNALPVGTFLGEFELKGVVGEGGFGIVYRAWDHSLKRLVAIKEYLPASLAMRIDGTQVSVRSQNDTEPFLAGLNSFVKEAQMLAQFDHPALVKVYRFWEANGSAYMVMPFYEGRTLRDELRQRADAPDQPTLLGWLGPVADALAVIHAESWYHRDIAPDNVLLLAGSNRPLLLDFGAARRVIGDMTQALTVILKPGYAPVEQYAEIPGMKQGPWTDVYALAGVAHFALRGRTPPPSVGRLVNDHYEPLAGSALEGRYSAGVLAAIDHALAVRPESRTKSIEEFKAELGLPPPPTPSHVGEFLAAGGAETQAAAEPGTTDLLLPVDAAPERTELVPPPAAKTAYVPPTMKTAYVPPQEKPAYPPRQEKTVYVPRPAAATPSGAAAAPAAAPSGNTGKWVGVGLAAAVVAGVAGFIAMRPRGEPVPAHAEAPAPVAAVAASAAATVASAAAAAPKLFDIGAEFDHVVAAQTPGWGLEVKVDKERLRINKDKLSFTLRSLQEGYVYVYNQGTDGQLQQLYPNGLTTAPRVAKGGSMKLPQGRLEFNTEGPAGASRLLVMVSHWPRDHKAFAPRDDGGFTTYPTGAAAALLAAANPGKLPLIAGQPVCAPGIACDDEFGAATTTYEVVP